MHQENKRHGSHTIAKLLRILAIVIMFSALGFWVWTGMHIGFSKDRVAIERVDPITEIEYVEYEERFVMGIEYLGAALAVSLLLFGASYLIPKKN